LKPKTPRLIAMPGKIAIHGAFSAYDSAGLLELDDLHLDLFTGARLTPETRLLERVTQPVVRPHLDAAFLAAGHGLKQERLQLGHELVEVGRATARSFFFPGSSAGLT
jgi:hypothetical protein